MLAGDGAVFETYQKRTTLISEWGRVARYHSRVGHRRCWTAAASKGLLSLVCVVLVLVAMRFASWTMMAVICFSVDDFFFVFFRSIALLILVLVFLVLVSPPHQVRTAADTASEDNSCGHRRCWTAAASKGLFCLVCVVLVLVAVRFASWTMMAVLCLSVDDFVLYFFRSIALLILVLVFLVLVSPPHEVRTAADTASEDNSCGHRRCWTAAASKLSLIHI